MSHAHDIFVDAVAETLGEYEAAPIGQIRRIVERLGARRVIELTQDAVAIQKNGGIPTPNGERLRTTGGVFFMLARGLLSSEDCRYVFTTTTTKAPGDQPGAFALSVIAGATTGHHTAIVAPTLKPVNTGLERRSNDHKYPRSQ